MACKLSVSVTNLNQHLENVFLSSLFKKKKNQHDFDTSNLTFNIKKYMHVLLDGCVY